MVRVSINMLNFISFQHIIMYDFPNASCSNPCISHEFQLQSHYYIYFDPSNLSSHVSPNEDNFLPSHSFAVIHNVYFLLHNCNNKHKDTITYHLQALSNENPRILRPNYFSLGPVFTYASNFYLIIIIFTIVFFS